MRYSERALLAGKTRCGKTTLARLLFSQMTGCRRIIANVKGRVQVGVPPVSDVAAIDWAAPVINWVPATFDRREFEWFYAECWAHRGPPSILWDDELSAVTSPNWAPDGWMMIQQQGGEWGFGHINCGQRLLNVKVEARTEAEEVFIWPGLSRSDLDWLAPEIGEVDGREITGFDLAARLRDLAGRYPAPPGSPVPSHAFLRWLRATGQLDDCEPLDAGWVDAPLHDVRTTSFEPSAPEDGAIDDAVDDDEHAETALDPD